MKFSDYIEKNNNRVSESSLNRIHKAWQEHATGTIR